MASSRPNLDSLPEEILIQILVRLPVKSLLQFRSTRKSCYSLITHRTFIDAHLKYQTSSSSSNNINNYLLLRYTSVLHNNYNVCYSIRYDNDSFNQYFQPEIPVHFKSLDIYGSCNGLVCLSERPLIASSTIHLWNPALRILKTLPKPQTVLDVSLVTHSTFVALGFGGNDYKVVKIVWVRPGMDSPSNTSFLVEVYSLSTDSWRRIIGVVPPSCCIDDWQPTIMKEAAYWIAYRKSEGKLVYTLLKFQMSEEVFEEVQLPEGIAQVRYPCIAVSGESLYLYNFGWSRVYECDVWRMECSKMGTWTKQFTFNFPDLNLTQIGFRRNGELLQVNHRNDLVSYNLENHQAKDLGIHARRICCLHSYVETLALLGEKDSFSTG